MVMVLSDHVPDDTGRLLVRLPVLVPQLVHRVEDTALDRFEAVADVGEGAPDDHAHRVIEVAPAHLVLDGAPLRGTDEQFHFLRFSCERGDPGFRTTGIEPANLPRFARG